MSLIVIAHILTVVIVAVTYAIEPKLATILALCTGVASIVLLVILPQVASIPIN